MESELVSGFMTEHSSVIFVFFFLAEYASLVLMCVLTSLLFLGGYNLDIEFISNLFSEFATLIDYNYSVENNVNNDIINEIIFSNEYLTTGVFKGVADGLILAFKSCVLIFTFIWVRASFPRVRYDQLMSFCWTILLPIVIAIIVLVPCIMYSVDFMRVK